jgi:hypothetical protein
MVNAQGSLVVAAVATAHDEPDADIRRLMNLSLTASDNAAAEQLWAHLGDPHSAAAQVQAVLRSGGDDDTVVQSRRVRPGFSAFGQTNWSLTNQAGFVAALPCLRYSDEVVALMEDVESDQRWGIGAVGLPAQFKGGWGLDCAGDTSFGRWGSSRLRTAGGSAWLSQQSPPVLGSRQAPPT